MPDREVTGARFRVQRVMTMTRAEKNTRLEIDHLMVDLGRRTASGGALAIGALVVKMALQLGTIAVMARQ